MTKTFLLICVLTIAALSCASRASLSNQSARETATVTVASPTPTPVQVSPIRLVDFDNISYPRFPDYSDPGGRKKKYVTLKPGEGGPNFINYGDVTGDGVEDAMVALGIDNRGSAIPEYVYIFTVEKGKPKLIWDFETGDRADGGLRNVYAEKGQLVIELFGKDRVIGGQLYRGDEGLCCPTSFTRTRYNWTGNHFALVSKEILENPSRDANPVMPQYAPKS